MAFGNATKGYVKKHSGGGGGGGTSNYNDLSNKPKINGVELTGNKTSEDLNIGGGTISLNESTMTYDSTYTYYSIPKTAKLVTFATCHQSFDNYRRTPEVINIETIKNCANSNTMKLFLLLPGATGVDIFEVSVENSDDNYILKYDYANNNFRMRDVFYI